jgi:DNA modification methylase
VKLWTNPGEVVFDPFAGIGTTPYVALEEGRRGLGFELKESYHRQACRNMERVAAGGSAQMSLEDAMGVAA